MNIGGKTISYSSFKKKQIDKNEQKVIGEINKLEEKKQKKIILREVPCLFLTFEDDLTGVYNDDTCVKRTEHWNF